MLNLAICIQLSIIIVLYFQVVIYKTGCDIFVSQNNIYQPFIIQGAQFDKTLKFEQYADILNITGNSNRKLYL